MSLLTPNWSKPNNVGAVSSTREDGASKAPFSGLNLGMHVGDEPSDVLANRHALEVKANMPSSPVWLNQTHSTKVVTVQVPTEQVLDADASFTRTPGVVLSAMTADCLPILICAKDGTAVAAIHAGWRGLADGIVEEAANLFDSEAQAWIGPAIGFESFEVGLDVKHAFCQMNPEYGIAFKESVNPEKWLANLALIAQMKLQASAISDVTQSNLCTFSDEKRFFSYRRDGQTGRMASFIWINH
ncbi:peptidoglycan editing factor PgeF [Vibrio barjaei]|jgi:YfiH family protein|uniref:Purine nucleoside phosphorylase n=1 Tax=Vibrio barjaei TaxID=1676683 RepID=A0ABW7IBC7_9VIBR|nr:peptidoglycan editing factor PgeF [Vibrio barjaei]MCY9870148.1 peptidoglycan editing factor PgeF [Vibrio barjaei]